MKLASLLTGIAMVGLVTVGDASLKAINPALVGVAHAAEAKQSGPTVQEKIALVTKNKGQIGGGDQLRRFFYGDLWLICTTKRVMSRFLTALPLMWWLR
jgi:hypothetical protein